MNVLSVAEVGLGRNLDSSTACNSVLPEYVNLEPPNGNTGVLLRTAGECNRKNV